MHLVKAGSLLAAICGESRFGYIGVKIDCGQGGETHEPTSESHIRGTRLEHPGSDIQKLAEMMKGIKFAMLTTLEEDGSLHSRPMATQQVDFDGELWFFTKANAPKVWEAGHHRQVNVSFADPEKSKFISASGTATLVRDRAKMQELWKAPYKVIFPEGLEDPEIALLKVAVEKAEYWDSSPTAIGRAFDFAKAYVTGDVSKLGEHHRVDMK